MDRDLTLIKKRRKVWAAWNIAIATIQAIGIILIAWGAVTFIPVIVPYGPDVTLAAVGLFASLLARFIGSVIKINKEMKSDVSTGIGFISEPSKELSAAYASVDQKVREHMKELKKEHPVVFISSLSYYPTYTRRHHVVAASVVITLRF